ncbi:homeobox-DDT domain protein RLT3 isoform X2 [Magnolia sinica]|uniref:homeobox-DDT domain protein RLT3 isoform X2 n=1 Tax=Magnolia sinica TaxID=86752 RepID=UPI002657D22F|nr:homeobox-DDT domain protein RLT3 isoform X2 [Magnolia sinica]
MENEVVAANQGNGTKRKTQFQLKSLESFYLDEKYPSQKTMEDFAASLKLTYKQVRGWFIERRRKEKREKGTFCSDMRTASFIGRVQAPDHSSAGASERKISKQGTLGQRGEKAQTYSICNQTRYSELDQSKSCNMLHSDNGHTEVVGHGVQRRAPGQHMKNSMASSKNDEGNKHLLQDVLPPDYILERIFRKDGPPLGADFDPLPAGAFGNHSGSNPPRRDSQKEPKRRKVCDPLILDHPSKNPSLLDSFAREKKSAPVKKYGIGKGLMTVWHATNPQARSFPSCVNFINREAAKMCFSSKLSVPRQLLHQETRKSQYRRIAAKQRTLGKKMQEKRKPSTKKQKVICNKDETRKTLHRAECILAIVGLGSQAKSDVSTVLMDDEELELRELQAGPNPLTCSAHITKNGRHGCSLCKDLLARFPPQSVKMKKPLSTRPWNSLPETVKKLFKVFRFLYTHSVAIDVCPFTLDEFAQAFHDKDSLLLGKIHVALLKLLLSDVDQELSGDFLPRYANDCRFLGFLHFVKQQEFDMKFWIRALNPLTWTEILRLVLVAAGFGSKQNPLRREILSKEGNRMAKYGLRPGTLKGELLSILYEQGSNGLKVSELAKSFQIVELNLPNTADELERMICSTLSSDITLFEKISSSAYRLRVNPQISKGKRNFQSDTEDSGSVDDDSGGSSSNSSSDDSDGSEELDSTLCEQRLVRYKGHRKQKNNKLTEYMEIDESHSGEAWMLGLMEGEYSDLSIEEKLNALVALVDLTGAGSSLRMEDPVRAISESMPDIQHRGSGAKLKRSSVNQHMLAKPFEGRVGQMHAIKQVYPSEELLSVDHSSKGKASSKMSGLHRPNGSKTKDTKAREESDMHPLQVIYLGSDRRYNSYWLFLGPCDEKDPGHRRVYFESSEDGHWEVIDTEQALCALLSVLDGRGTREAHLLSSLEKREASLSQAMAQSMAIVSEIRQPARSDQSDMDVVSGDGSSPISDVDNNLTPTEVVNDHMASSCAIVLEHGKNGEEKRQRWDRLQALDAWIWNFFYSNLNAVKCTKRSYLESLARCESCHDLFWRDEKHCRTCHTTFELDFDMEERYAIHIATCREKGDVDMFPSHKVLPSQLQSLKAAVHAIEAAMPEDALLGAWRKSAHKLWVKRLRRTSSLPELLQVLNDFVSAINEEWLCQCNVFLGPNTALEEILVFFPTLPQTTSAVALWLVKLDAAIAPHLERVQSEKTVASMPRLRGP